MAGNLGYDGRDICSKLEISVFSEEPKHSAEIDRGKEVLDISIKHISLVAMCSCIRHNRELFFESVRKDTMAART